MMLYFFIWSTVVGLTFVASSTMAKISNTTPLQQRNSSGQPSSPMQTLVPFNYDLLPIGQVQPLGWMKDQLQLEANGLAGHLFDFYRYVKSSTWLGGTYEYSELHEAAPYWYNGIVPLAYVLNDERLKAQVNQFLKFVIEHQAEDGWLGPETTRQTRGIWARCLLLQGMMNHAIADPQQEENIVASMFRFVGLANTMLKDNYTGFIEQPGDDFDPYGFGIARAHELSTTLQWMYEAYPGRDSALLWETMDLMWSGAKIKGRDWTTFFVEGSFPTEATPKPSSNFEHGVNLAEGLRYPFQLYRMNKNASLLQQSRDAVNMTVTYQGTVSGSITADEYLGGISPERGSELCMSVETIFSLSYLYRATGDNYFADRAELAAFNALPAAISSDWWSHQYVTQVNQPWSKNLTGQPYYNVVPYGNVFGLEPNFPCCTVNHPQALPKFLVSAYVRKGSSGIIHQFLIPSAVNTDANGGEITISCETKYPFGQTLSYTITSTRPFDFYIRVPDWATPGSTINTSIDGYTWPLQPNSESLHMVALKPGRTEISVNLNAEVRVVPRPNNTVAVYRGALLYALEFNYSITDTPVLNWTDRTPLPSGQIMPNVHDHEITPVSFDSWAVAIDPSQIVVRDSSNSDRPLASPIYAREAPPIYLSVAATKINWPQVAGTAGLPPSGPEQLGETFLAKLVPYGSAKLHMAELPSISLAKLVQ